MDNHSNLLTEKAKIAKLKSILPSQNRRGRFFIPDNTFYTPPRDDEGLKAVVKQLSQWVGFKPIGLTVSFNSGISTASEFSFHHGKPTLLIHDRFRNNPFASS